MTEAASQLDTVGVTAVMALIPHRYPMLLVDRVRDIVPDVSAVGIKAVTINEPFLLAIFRAGRSCRAC